MKNHLFSEKINNLEKEVEMHEIRALSGLLSFQAFVLQNAFILKTKIEIRSQ